MCVCLELAFFPLFSSHRVFFDLFAFPRRPAALDSAGDIYDKIQEELAGAGLDTECLGGGRILHDPAKKTIEVFGYSQVSLFSFHVGASFGELLRPVLECRMRRTFEMFAASPVDAGRR